MAKYVTDGKVVRWKNICINIINDLLTFNYPLVLIPHVLLDYSFMKSLLVEIKNKSSIQILPNNLNAAQYKWVISKSLCNSACRTHANIASFSSSIPTVSLGYSIKSRGLNLQMYGNEDLLLYKNEINPTSVQKKVLQCLTKRTEISTQLLTVNKNIEALSIRAGHILVDYIKGFSK